MAFECFFQSFSYKSFANTPPKGGGGSAPGPSPKSATVGFNGAETNCRIARTRFRYPTDDQLLICLSFRQHHSGLHRFNMHATHTCIVGAFKFLPFSAARIMNLHVPVHLNLYARIKETS